jgi:Flp pilus assembly protein TadB
MSEGIIVALIMGGMSLIGIIYTATRTHSIQEERQNSTLKAVQAEYISSLELLRVEFRSSCEMIMGKIKELEKKQDKHNGIAEKVYKAEGHIKDLDRRLNALGER